MTYADMYNHFYMHVRYPRARAFSSAEAAAYVRASIRKVEGRARHHDRALSCLQRMIATQTVCSAMRDDPLVADVLRLESRTLALRRSACARRIQRFVLGRLYRPGGAMLQRCLRRDACMLA